MINSDSKMDNFEKEIKEQNEQTSTNVIDEKIKE